MSDPDPINDDYLVTFERSVRNCVVFAVAGAGDPPGAVIGSNGFADVYMPGGTAEQVLVAFSDANGAHVESPFMIACLLLAAYART